MEVQEEEQHQANGLWCCRGDDVGAQDAGLDARKLKFNFIDSASGFRW